MRHSATRGVNNIELLTRPLTVRETDSFYEQADAVMSLHRSAGFGFVIAEAMLRGLPVIATDWVWKLRLPQSIKRDAGALGAVAAADPQGEYDRLDLCWADPLISMTRAQN